MIHDAMQKMYDTKTKTEARTRKPRKTENYSTRTKASLL